MAAGAARPISAYAGDTTNITASNISDKHA